MDREEKKSKSELISSEEEIKNLKNTTSFYENLRKRIKIWVEKKGGSSGSQVAEIILLAPDFFMLLVRLARDPRVSTANKALIFGGITYFMTPIDIIPEALFGPWGFIDDVVMATFILNKVLNTNRDVVLENWSGSQSLLNYVQNITAEAENVLGKKTFNKLHKYFKKILPD